MIRRLTSLLLIVLAPNAGARPPHHDDGAEPLPWLHGDYPAAVARGAAEHKPVVIDFWAPWCHTCRSMQQTVLRDPRVAAHANEFIWLSLDTDAPTADPVVARFPLAAWPTFLIIDGKTEAVEARQVGSTSAPQFEAFLAEGARAFADTEQRQALAEDDPTALCRLGDRASQRGEAAAAAKAYAKALERAPADWPGRPAARVDLVSAWLTAKDVGACVDYALGQSAVITDGPSAADFVAVSLECADGLPEADGRRRAFQVLAERALTTLVSDKRAPLSVDDRGDAMRILRDLRVSLGDTPGAASIAEAAIALLDTAATAAKNPHEAATYNMARVDAYTFVGRGEGLLPALTTNVAALPSEYDPPYRLAQLYVALKRPGDALAAARKALATVRGLRTRRVLSLIVDIETTRGEPDALAKAQKDLADFDALHPPKPH